MMNSRTLLFRGLCFTSLALLLLARIASADELSSKLEEYLQACAQVEKFSGSVLVSKEDKTLLAKGYGWANVEHQVPNGPETKFRLGSISKQFTAAAILLLQEKGKLNVKDAVAKHLVDAPEAWKDITIHHLLSHTSGIPNFTSFPDYGKTWMIAATVEQTIARFRDKPLEFTPGEQFKYSNSGYILLGAIIEKASGKTYEEFLTAAIFKPLGLNETGYDHHTPVLAHRAAGYDRQAEGVANSAYIDMSIPHAAGALYSTVGDLAKWDEALTAGRLLSAESFAAMYTPVKGGYAYGWAVKPGTKHKEISHGGGINGFGTYILRYPDEKVYVVVLSNVVPTPTSRMAHDLAAIVFEEPYKTPKKREVVKVDPKIYDAYVGRYQIMPEFILTIERQGDRLLAQATGQPQFELFPESATEFFYKVVDAQVTFVKNDKGEVTHLVLHQGGLDLQAKRLEDER